VRQVHASPFHQPFSAQVTSLPAFFRAAAPAETTQRENQRFLTPSPNVFGSSFSDALSFPHHGYAETGKMSRVFQLPSTFFPFQDDSC
jgi:hypothetical protein